MARLEAAAVDQRDGLIMKNPARSSGGAGQDNTCSTAAEQDFRVECQRRGWTVEQPSDRVLKVTKAGSTLFLSSHPDHFAEALDRVRDADAYAMRHYRP